DTGTRRARHRARGRRRRWPHSGRVRVADRDVFLWRHAGSVAGPLDWTPGRGDNCVERTASKARGAADEPAPRTKGTGTMIPQRHIHEQGFTLMELLVAVTLLALLTTLVFGAIKYSGRAWAETDRRAVAAADLSAVQSVFLHAITGAYPAFASADP